MERKEGEFLLLCFSWGTMAWGLAWVGLRSRQWFGMGVGGGNLSGWGRGCVVDAGFSFLC